ncbi:hypothetical protein CM318V1_210103 [Carnobacterium maltaromaticum]|uniref:hypothetical protein n=1 Tax=Carnobacterium maltaromaticum TaxID=2751 RepID=UPI0007054EC3|nr:hypothetical protein [Carnobacterium maltaromaticum]KRN72377.1 hypothetical protein IV76_GL002603 [Carnobacterium maltaromaticum]CRH18084.1 hypothetical protein CM318V1_210103 [Carnobacterium maltaromaticum]
MVEFLKKIWKIVKKNRYAIILIFIVLFILSYTIGIGVRYFPNLGTYGSASEWFGFWGNVVGGIISTLIAAGIAYFVSKKENEKNNAEQKSIRKKEKKRQDKLQKRIEKREENIIKETALMKIKISSIEKCMAHIDTIENITKPTNNWLDLYEVSLQSYIDSERKSVEIITDEFDYMTSNIEVGKIIKKMKNLMSLSLIVDIEFFLDEYEENLANICTNVSTLNKAFVYDIVPGCNLKSEDLPGEISKFISDKKEYEDSLNNLKNELINKIKNL